jgi:hypothetical protein
MAKETVEINKLITPAAYAKKIGVTPAAVTKQMNTDKVKSINIIGGRIIEMD